MKTDDAQNGLVFWLRLPMRIGGRIRQRVADQLEGAPGHTPSTGGVDGGVPNFSRPALLSLGLVLTYAWSFTHWNRQPVIFQGSQTTLSRSATGPRQRCASRSEGWHITPHFHQRLAPFDSSGKRQERF